MLLNLEDDLTDPKMLVEQFLDAHGLVLELHRDEILNPDVNHVGIGLGAFEMRICLVYVLNHKSVVCTEVDESDDGGIVVSGKILRNDLGIYVVTIVDRISMK